MTTDSRFHALEPVWRQAREIGALGSAPINELLEHAAGYIPAAFRVDERVHCVDVGSGVGVPGIFLATLLPHSTWTLIDSSERRCDLARQAVAAVGLNHRVAVIHGRVDDLAHDPDHRESYELVVARLFAAPPETAECCVPLVAVGGSLIVSSSRSGVEAWGSADLSRLGGVFDEHWESATGSYVRVSKVVDSSPELPRRTNARRRSPLF